MHTFHVHAIFNAHKIYISRERKRTSLILPSMSHYFCSMRANIMEEAIHPFHFGAKGKTEIKMNVVQKRQIDKNQND